MFDVSVIVPSYNSQSGIKRCIKSLSEQDCTNFEIIIIDDGSFDGSAVICDMLSLSGKIPITVIHKNNKGVSSARNKGLELATGKYIVFADSDDFVKSDYLSELLKVKRQYPEVEHIWSLFKTITNRNETKKVFNPANSDEKILWYTNEDLMTLYHDWLLQGPYCKLFSSKTLSMCNIRFDEHLSLGEDLLFNLDYLEKSENQSIALINKPLYNYVCDNNESLANVFRENIFDINKTIDSRLKYLIEKWNLSDSAFQLYYNNVYHHYYNALQSIYKNGTFKSKKAKFEYLNARMKDKEFQNAIRKIDFYVNPALLLILKLKNYKLVEIFEIMVRLKKWLTKH